MVKAARDLDQKKSREESHGLVKTALYDDEVLAAFVEGKRLADPSRKLS